MKKTAILTFQDADNYGAMLQCYALQKVIQNMGEDCEVIDYKCQYLSKPYSLAALKRKGIFRYILGNVNSVVRKPRTKKFKEFRSKIKKTIQVDSNSIFELNNEYDAFITGSDQVWNYELTDFDKTFFLDFVADDKKKMSYAASIGVDFLPTGIDIQYKELLEKFNYINVRESTSQTLLEKLINKEINVVLDPTMLLDREDWDNVLTEPKEKEKYIFVYQLTPSKFFSRTLRQLRRETGLKIVAVPFAMGPIKSKNMLSVGPSEWVGLIKNSEYVVTDSFHATVFSLLYQKKVYCCVNEVANRICDLLKLTELDKLLFTHNRQFELIDNINYSNANKIIMMEKQKSINLLKNMLESI